MVRRMNRLIRTATLVVAPLFLLPVYGSPESLWDPSFDGYISSASAFPIGGTLVVELDSRTMLTITSSRVHNQRIDLEISGGEAGGLFDFLPSGGSSSSASVTGKDDLSLDAVFAVRIVSVGPDGMLRVDGSRIIVTDDRSQTIELEGIVDPRLVSDGSRIASSAIADLVIRYSGVLDRDSPAVVAADLVRIVENGATDAATPSGSAAAGTAAVAASTRPSPADAGATGVPPALELTEEKRDELLVELLDRILSLALPAR
jgi:hypothetical protein